MDAKIAKKSAKPLVVRLRRVDAENVNSLGRGQFEAWKHGDAPAFGGASEGRNSTCVVVIGDGKYRDTEIGCGRHNGLGMRSSRSIRLPTAKSAAVVVGIHLERAPMKHGAARESRSDGDGITHGVHTVLLQNICSPCTSDRAGISSTPTPRASSGPASAKANSMSAEV